MIVEVTTALHFKKSLENDFKKISNIVRVERDYLFGLMISADLVYDLSSLSDNPKDFKADHILRNLYQISDLQKRIISDVSKENLVLNIQNQISQLQKFAPQQRSPKRIRELKSEMVKSVNVFSKDLHVGIFRLTNQRNKMINDYNKKSDFSAWLLLAIGLAGFAIVCIGSGGFLAGLVRSFSRMEKHAKQISEGNYGERLEIDRDDEIGRLVSSINTMASSLEERENQVAESRRRLLQQEKMFTIGIFAAGIAHEIGNPIQAISALASHVADNLEVEKDNENKNDNLECIGMIIEQTERLDKVIREVREFNYSGAIEKRHSDLNGVVLSTMRMMRYDHRFREIEVSTELADDLVPIYVVPDHITQILMNLLINSADAIDNHSGRIVVRTMRDQGFVELSVSDNGCGMSQESLGRAREPFFTTKKIGKGTGLGLAVCQQIAEEHNGELKIKSVENNGSIISIRLPEAVDEGLLGEGI